MSEPAAQGPGALPPPPVFDPQMFPSIRRPWWQFFLDHNPCLLLSTVLMLLGCYLINSTLGNRADDQVRLVALLGVINLYELCIIPLGLVLIRRSRGTARDGLWLLLFETLFLVNGTFLNVDPTLLGGWFLNAGLLVLALLKAAILFHGLGLGFRLRTWGFLAGQLTLIYALPIILWAASKDGAVPINIMYALWWVVGLLPLAYDLLARVDRNPAPYDLVQTVIRRTYLIAPWIMLLIHLRFSHWAHHSDFTWADLAPICLGLTIATNRVRMPVPLLQLTRLLPVAALFLTFTAPVELEWPISLITDAAVRPGGLVIVAVLLTYSYLVSLWAAGWTAVMLTLAICAYYSQEILFRAGDAVLSVIVRIVRFFAGLVPTTANAWGILAVAGAFVLLALGARSSLKRSRSDVVPEAARGGSAARQPV